MVLILAAALVTLRADNLPWHAEVDFNHEIRPIFNQRCLACHGGVKRSGGFSLLFRSDALEPTESGQPAIVPGRPDQSELIHRVTHSDPEQRMPLDDHALSASEVRKLRRWIAQGAKWADHWAYVPPQPIGLPAVSNPAWAANGIDHFILARLDQERLTPADRADCATLIRRVSLDLIGLPPSPQQAEAFCQDPTQEAYERFVDTLLASPRFGERWAAMWLDLARYADSKGYEKDDHRTIWKFRDWVIQAFNEDMPFDRFTIEQIAGDLLPKPTTEQLIATAFHRNTMTNDEGGTDDEEFRIAAIIDRVNTTWEVWQGTTMACVQCHSHPYDPFRHEEYFKFFAFFNNTEDADRADEKPVLTLFPEEHSADGNELLARLAETDAAIDSLAASAPVTESRRAWESRLQEVLADTPKPGLFEGRLVPDEILRIVGLGEDVRSPAQQAQLRRYYASFAPELIDERAARRDVERAIAALKPIHTPIMRELPAVERRRTHVFERGNWLVHGEEVQAGVPASMHRMPEDAPDDRLGVARWLVSTENPLTARVMVNRFWEQIFGNGIVETIEDFGTQGMRPTHQELLDWLALRFLHEHQWSVKQLLKEIVLSATYQQSSRVSPEVLEADPRNRLLARGVRVRLSAEQVRDQALAVSGLLSDKMLGPSVMPPQPEGLWQNPYSSLRWITSEGEDRYRRGLYTYWRRTVPYPSMVAFDSPSREVCVSRRITTNTPLQALVTLNDPVFVEAAQALARRMLEEGGTRVDDQLATGFALALARQPRPETLAELRSLYEHALERYREAPDQHRTLTLVAASETEYERDAEADGEHGADAAGPELAALTLVANTILNLDAFIVKE